MKVDLLLKFEKNNLKKKFNFIKDDDSENEANEDINVVKNSKAVKNKIISSSDNDDVDVENNRNKSINEIDDIETEKKLLSKVMYNIYFL